MSLAVFAGPVADPVTLAEARAQLRVTDNSEDTLIVGYLLAARSYVETYLGAALLAQTWDQTIDEFVDPIVLMKWPVQSITSITYIDSNGATQTLAADQYRLIRTPEGFWAAARAYGVSWPAVRAIEGAVTVRFVCGYGLAAGSIPEEIRQSILLLVGHWYANREAVNVGNITSELPFAVEALLFPHRPFFE